VYYGQISLRAALGNSLNVPAIKAIQLTGVRDFLSLLRSAGFESLSESPEHYGEGLALGNGEVTLYELARGYAALANRGTWRPLRHQVRDPRDPKIEAPRSIVSPEVASVIGDILSDPQARSLEFGSDGLLRFPVETAVKTGTSTDYRDAWAVGYSANFTVGVWMGNLNRSSMLEISGARGPALVLRSVFAELERSREPRALYRGSRLAHRDICAETGAIAGDRCARVHEIFVAGSEPRSTCDHAHDKPQRELEVVPRDIKREPRIVMPSAGLHIARDPRVPDSAERLVFELQEISPSEGVEWIVDGSVVGSSPRGRKTFPWALTPGYHVVRAVVGSVGDSGRETAEVGFLVR
jgi:penicillin-binding protein 1C